jgi:hypothetical protein
VAGRSGSGAEEARTTAELFAQDQREAAERMVREKARLEAAERAHAEYERARREMAEMHDPLRTRAEGNE